MAFPNEIKNIIISYLDANSFYNCLQLNKEWNHVGKKRRLEDLQNFCNILLNISQRNGFITSSYQASCFKSNIQTIQKELQNKNIDLKKNHTALLNAFFEEMTKNALGYPSGLSGVRMKILATIEIPITLKNLFNDHLEKFISSKLQKHCCIELRGSGEKIDPNFLNVLLSSIESMEKTKFISLRISGFDLDHEDNQRIKALNNSFRNLTSSSPRSI